MNDPCPVCGILLQCEPGYYLGAMYVSYAISSALLCGGYFALAALLPDWNSFLVVGLLVLLYLPLVPAVFQYSRAIWIYFDRWDRTSDALSGSYERARAAELTGREAGEAPGLGATEHR